jgi:hypothetical protein
LGVWPVMSGGDDGMHRRRSSASPSRRALRLPCPAPSGGLLRRPRPAPSPGATACRTIEEDLGERVPRRRAPEASVSLAGT